MKELDLIQLWVKARNHIIVSQLAPTALLIFAIAILPSMTMASLTHQMAFILVLLSSGVLGAAAQISSANEATAIAQDLRNLDSMSAVSARIAATAPWLVIVKFGTPAIFTLTYIAILMQLFLGYMRY
ncbi:hypothetical protein [Rhodoluna limnophila]|uniref:hypothetical protein n=1 Tax=Rhodoluna limnophila TaxID=232537 RepID=UPI001105E3A8|nr:hypothetical protein [Rhodoluna limnophila]